MTDEKDADALLYLLRKPQNVTGRILIFSNALHEIFPLTENEKNNFKSLIEFCSLVEEDDIKCWQGCKGKRIISATGCDVYIAAQ